MRTKAGNKVVFGDDAGDFIESKRAGNRTYMKKQNGAHVLTMWRDMDGTGGVDAQPFTRQGI